LQRLRLHELLQGDAMAFEVLAPAGYQSGNLLAPAAEEEPEHLLHPPALEELDAARAQARALDQELAPLIQENVVLHLVGEHRLVAAVELELDACGKNPLQLGGELGLGILPGVRRRRGEVDA